MPRNPHAFFSRSAARHPHQRARLEALRDALVRRVGESGVAWSRDPIDLRALSAGAYDPLFYLPLLTAAASKDEGARAELAAVLARARSGSVLVVPILLEDGAHPSLADARDLRSWWASESAVSEAAAALDEIAAWMTVRVGMFSDDEENWDLADDVSPISLPSPRPEPARVFVPHNITKVPADETGPTRVTYVEDDVLVTEDSEPRGTVRAPAPQRPRHPYRRRRGPSPSLAIGGALTLALGTGAAMWQLRPTEGVDVGMAMIASPPSPLAEAPPAEVRPAPAAEPTCGDGQPDPGEECDFGAAYNGPSPGGCTADCRLPWQSVPAGTYLLGSSPTREPGRGEDEPWTRPVASAGFQILPTEVTAAQRARFGAPQGGDAPQAGVTWHEASAFCAELGGRLPTEAEWEAAARATKRTAWTCGDDPSCLRATAWYADTAAQRAHPVAQRAPNDLGLYDMEGNVWEWVQDCYYPAAYRIAEIDDAQRYAIFGSCNWRVVRGGSYRSGADLLRSAFRGRRRPSAAEETVGFRCVKGPQAAAHPPRVTIGT